MTGSEREGGRGRRARAIKQPIDREENWEYACIYERERDREEERKRELVA